MAFTAQRKTQNRTMTRDYYLTTLTCLKITDLYLNHIDRAGTVKSNNYSTNCFNDGKHYSGTSILNSSVLVDTTTACQRLCRTYPTCKYWALDAKSKFCSLMSSKDKSKDSSISVSGPRSCSKFIMKFC